MNASDRVVLLAEIVVIAASALRALLQRRALLTSR
jgi:hypothetical protein